MESSGKISKASSKPINFFGVNLPNGDISLEELFEVNYNYLKIAVARVMEENPGDYTSLNKLKFDTVISAIFGGIIKILLNRTLNLKAISKFAENKFEKIKKFAEFKKSKGEAFKMPNPVFVNIFKKFVDSLPISGSVDKFPVFEWEGCNWQPSLDVPKTSLMEVNDDLSDFGTVSYELLVLIALDSEKEKVFEEYKKLLQMLINLVDDNYIIFQNTIYVSTGSKKEVKNQIGFYFNKIIDGKISYDNKSRKRLNLDQFLGAGDCTSVMKYVVKLLKF